MTRARRVITAILLSLTLLAGVSLALFHVSTPGSDKTNWTALQETFGTYSKTDTLRDPNPAGITKDLSSRIPIWLDKAIANKELIFYATLAVLAVLMVLIAIGSTARKRVDPKDSILETLKEAKEKAENLAKLKADFLNHVSHELRTPLAVIIGYIECITDGLYGQVDSKHQEILEIVAKQSTQLKEMIDQILIYSRMDSNRQASRVRDFHVSEIVKELKDTFDFFCQQKNLDLRWETPKRAISLSTDAERLKEILSNLLQNAVKYTDRGSITVRAVAESPGDKIRFEITDTGLGIPQSYLATIFEPFVQVHRSSTDRSRGGIGLGLSIVKKHVDQIKGSILVQSELGRGSTFTVTIPRVFEKQTARSKQFMSFVKFAYPRRNTQIHDRSHAQQKSADAADRTQAVSQR